MPGQTRCNECRKKISINPKIGILHYKKFHPDQPETCYNQFETTWDPTMTRLIKGAHECVRSQRLTLEKLNQTIKQLEDENKLRLTLTTKLNGIIMILQSKQEG